MGVERNHFVKKTKIKTGTTLILISIYGGSGEGFIGERKSNPLICKSVNLFSLVFCWIMMRVNI